MVNNDEVYVVVRHFQDVYLPEVLALPGLTAKCTERDTLERRKLPGAVPMVCFCHRPGSDLQTEKIFCGYFNFQLRNNAISILEIRATPKFCVNVITRAVEYAERTARGFKKAAIHIRVPETEDVVLECLKKIGFLAIKVIHNEENDEILMRYDIREATEVAIL